MFSGPEEATVMPPPPHLVKLKLVGSEKEKLREPGSPGCGQGHVQQWKDPGLRVPQA